MPVIDMTLGKGQATAEQKEEMIQAFTKSASEATGIPAQSFIVLIHELESDNIGVAGNTLTKIRAARKG